MEKIVAIRSMSPSNLITKASQLEKLKLRKHFGRFDMFAFLICAIVGVDTLGRVAAAGRQGLLGLMFLAIFFFAPYGLLVAELGSAFTEEGGPYVWNRMAWGRRIAGMNSIFYWFANPVWVGATLALLAIAAIQNYLFHFADNSFWFYLIGLAFIWITTGMAIISFGIGKWIPTIGAGLRIVLIGLFAVTTFIYAAKEGIHLPKADEFSPSWASFIALTPVLFYNLVGFELPNSAGEEMKNPKRDVPFTVLRAIITSTLLYGLPVLAIVCVVPADQIKGKGVSSFLDAVGTVFSVYGSAGTVMLKIAAIVFILAMFAGGVSWLMGADRIQAMASIDGTGPRWLGTFSSKFGTPVNANIVSGIVGTIAFLLATNIGSGSAANAFNIMIGIVLLFTTVNYIVTFPALIKLRKSHPDVHRPYKVPGGIVGVWICSIVTTFWAVLATTTGIFPGLLSNGKLLDDSALPDGVHRTQFTTYAFVAIGATLVVGVIFYAMGKATRDDLVESA